MANYMDNVRLTGTGEQGWSFAGMMDGIGSYLVGGNTYEVDALTGEKTLIQEGSQGTFSKVGSLFKRFAAQLDDSIAAKYATTIDKERFNKVDKDVEKEGLTGVEVCFIALAIFFIADAIIFCCFAANGRNR